MESRKISWLLVLELQNYWDKIKKTKKIICILKHSPLLLDNNSILNSYIFISQSKKKQKYAHAYYMHISKSISSNLIQK